MKKIVALAALLFSVAASANDVIDAQDVHAIKFGAHHSVDGIAHNNSDATLGTVLVKFKLYDQQGNLVGNTMAAVQDLAPGENFKFSALTTLDFAEARLSGVETH